MGKNILHKIFQPSNCLTAKEISDYLGGSATRQDIRRVEDHLCGCPLCSDALEGFSERVAATASYQPESFSDFKKKLPTKKEAKVRQLSANYVWTKVAAVAAVFLCVAGYFAWFQPVSHDRLYSQFYTGYDNEIPIGFKGSEAEPLDPDLLKALENYEAGNFEDSLLSFAKVIAADPSNDAARFYAGMAYMKSEEWENAAQYFIQVKENNGIYARKAAWYLILTTLKNGDKEQTKELLEEFLKTGGFKEKEAQELQKEL